MGNQRQIYDNHGRPISYVRLAVTDRCNLRCFYCMPAEGIDYVPRQQLLSYEEMLRLVRILSDLGVSKVRITGGEPFVRKDLMPFLEDLTHAPGIEAVNITTNGVLTKRFIPAMKAAGIRSVNLSLDTLDRERFKAMTRRDELPKVLACLDDLLAAEIPTKINAVILDGRNTQDILPMAGLTRHLPVEVRFIEEMPFNGSGANAPALSWDHQRILNELKSGFPDISPVPAPPHSTARLYQIPGHRGRIGIIAAFSRTFCGSCNRIRVTAQGTLKTCLYDHGVLDLRQLMRSGASDAELTEALLKAFGNRAKDGFEAEARRDSEVSESMSTIGG